MRTIIKIVIIIAVTAIAYSIFQIILRSNSETDIDKMVLQILIPSVVLILSIISNYVLKHDRKVDRPYIDPLLVISETNDKSFKYHIKIKNIGKLPTDEIVCIVKSKYFSCAEIIPNKIRNLAPNATLIVNQNEESIEYDNYDEIIRIDVLLNYNVYYRGCSVYKSEYTFEMRGDSIKEGDVIYVSSKHDNGIVYPQEQLDYVDPIDKSENPEGTMLFDFSEDVQHPSIRSVLFSSPTKGVFYDPYERKICYLITDENGNNYALEKFFTNENREHKVGIRWGENMIALVVDGEILKPYADQQGG